MHRPIFALMCLSLWTATAHCVGAAESQPNIVLFLADDLGWTGLRCFGSDYYETPHLDQMATEGVRFTDAYAACTVCSPTRASIMTGQYPARLHLTDFIAGQHRPYAKLSVPEWTKLLETKHVTLAEALRGLGYRTAHIGKWHLSDRNQPTVDARHHGFDVSHDKPPGTRGYMLRGATSQQGSRYLTDYLADRASEFIEDSSPKPFFLYFAFHVPHTPIQGRPDLVKYFADKRDSEALHNNPIYAAMVASLDQAVGRVLTCLREQEIEDETLVVFTSDNGGLTQRYGKHDGFTENLPLRRGKGSAYEGGVRVPTIVRWPGHAKPGAICKTPVMSIDFFSTLLDAAGGAKHSRGLPEVDGRSMVPLLRDPAIAWERDLFWHYPHYHAGGDGPYSAMRSGRWRLIEFHETQRTELYDLVADVGEQHDLSADQPKRVSELSRRLHAWRQSVGAQMPTDNTNFDADRARVVGKRKGLGDPKTTN